MKIYRTLLIAVIFITILITNLNSTINKSFENFVQRSFGETEIDSNIVVIEITQNDIDKLGGFPIKRNYYALLLKKLNDQNPKVAGFEIFLSPKNHQQSIYNDVLLNQIKNFPCIVFSNFIDSIDTSSEIISADKVNYSQPKQELGIIKDGHINYYEKNGLVIPQSIIIGTNVVKSFSSEITENFTGQKLGIKETELNIHCSYSKIKRISFLKFLSLEDNSTQNTSLKNKIVLIGVSEPTLAHSEKSAFDDELPGIGIHAFAISNLLNHNYINSNFYTASSFLFIILVLLLSLLKFSHKLYSVIFVFSILIFVILFNWEYIKLDYASLLLPLIGLVIWETVETIMYKGKELNKALIEKDKLLGILKLKEDELKKLSLRLTNTDGKESAVLKGRIRLLENEITNLRKFEADEDVSETLEAGSKNFHGIIYKSEVIEKIVKLIKKAAPTDATVLILGESGSGKELVARAIHELSGRKDQNFIAVNCAALTESLLETELFGHVKGAFTNAVADKKGRFELANNGTIFLDEIGETDDNFQAKLLRVLQSGEYERVGEGKTLNTNARIIAATNKELDKLVKEKIFRDDLYYRLNVIKIELPPLRERKEDIELISEFFLKRENPELKFSKAAIKQICENSWEGNVRELESVVKRAVIFANSENRDIIKLNDLPDELSRISSDSKDTLILESLREKGFSHSSIVETVKEMNGLSRTIVSETFRGISFQYYCENGFDITNAVISLAATNDENIIKNVNKKLSTYLKNIRQDIKKSSSSDFESLRNEFVSKYKNLPSRYHEYLDLIIKDFLN
ncbi:MAG: sigma 54-interacting transcriptional regulator [Melioribacteraceae bacterium]|nr:sigma 54-interacting transcriptional regulator [Melioribacteraceae bacterium]